MKKFLLFILIIFCHNSFVFSEEQEYNPNRPEWNEFCPYGFENIVQPEDKFSKKILYSSRLKLEEQKYWANRKADFEQNLAFCDGVDTKNRNACYEKLRNRQYQINASYVSAQEKYAQQQSQWAQVGNNIQRQLYQQKQLNLQEKNMIMQNLFPKKYNVNLNHNVRYYGF